VLFTTVLDALQASQQEDREPTGIVGNSEVLADIVNFQGLSGGFVENTCSDPYCGAVEQFPEFPDALGWDDVEGRRFCPLHWYTAYREAKKERVRNDLTAQRRHHEEQVARKMFSAAEYRAWDQFQSDLADYHRDTGKLAPKVLREMNPSMWVTEFKQKGRIDVQKTADWYANAEKTKMERLKGL
jgi:hypothetical protein